MSGIGMFYCYKKQLNIPLLVLQETIKHTNTTIKHTTTSVISEKK